MSNEIIELINISHNFGEEDILKNVSVNFGRHEFITILGPSGCGKTTMLRLIGGFLKASEGSILFNGEDITNLPPYKRALVNEPDVLLLDEPLGALDLKLRKEMQLELKKIQKALGITFIYVTHDQEEALAMSDEIIILNEGIIQQKGSPVDIYNEPKNAFVAKFIGESNIIDGVMKKDFLVNFADGDYECVDSGFEANEKVDVVIRPEDIKLSKNSGRLMGKVSSVVFRGVHYEMVVETEYFDFTVQSTLMEPVGTEVSLTILPNDIHIMKKVMPDE